MAEQHETETDASLDVSHGPANYQLFDDNAVVKVKGPEKFKEGFDESLRFHLSLDDEEYDRTWGTAGFSLSREQAKELGEWLLEHHDDEETVMLRDD